MNIYFYGLAYLCVISSVSEAQWCSQRSSTPKCCPGRTDACTAPIQDTLCYCDIFCNRTVTDCCPDFWQFCLGIEPPTGAWTVPTTARPIDIVTNKCTLDGITYKRGTKVKNNCNYCTCEEAIRGRELNWRCTNNACLIRPDLMQKVNENRKTLGWHAGNYSFFWGLTLDEGMRYRLGTEPPQRDTARMTSMRVHSNEILPHTFDARRKWPNMIHPVRDQGNCASSWAFSTADMASDRLSIHSHGGIKDTLSVQNLISCNTKNQDGCQGGHVDRAWWYLRKKGVVSDSCYQYTSGTTDKRGHCMVPRSSRRANRFKREVSMRCPSTGQMTSSMYQCTPPYRISPRVRDIMKEIEDNGPVQATFFVPEDFYMYKGGVYKHAKLTENEPEANRKKGYHSGRIIGWGEDTTEDRYNPVPYWLVANSWGRRWGEDGTFKILRGKNECDVESFIVGVWGKVDNRRVNNARRNRRKFRKY